jgi:hypothetical protein
MPIAVNHAQTPDDGCWWWPHASALVRVSGGAKGSSWWRKRQFIRVRPPCTLEGRMHTQVALTYPVSHDPCSNRNACACSHTLACAHAWHVAVTMCAHPGESARRRAGVGAMVCVPPGEMPGAPPIVCVRPGESARSGAGACAPMRHTPRCVDAPLCVHVCPCVDVSAHSHLGSVPPVTSAPHHPSLAGQ